MAAMLNNWLLMEKALELRTRVAVYRVSNTKANNVVANFPESIDGIPWRRVYAPNETLVATGLIDVVWTPNELSQGGNGSMWCFTLLPRGGRNGDGNIMRRTDIDGESWSSRTGRCPKNGFPKNLLVDRLLLGCFEMIELTAGEEDKPIVALCKITRKNTTAAQSIVMVPSLNSEVGAQQQIHGLSNIITKMPQLMEERQIQEVNPEITAHMPVIQVQIDDGYFGSAPSAGETERGTRHSMRGDTNSIFQQTDAFGWEIEDLIDWDRYDEEANQAAPDVNLDGNEDWLIVDHLPGGHAD